MADSIVKFLVHKDGKVVQELPVTAFKKIAVGRLESADWVIEHPSGSRQHACVELDATGLHIIDLGSAHGTTKNGERLPAKKRVAIRSGDCIMFGGSSRRYVVSMGEGRGINVQAGAPGSLPCPWAGGGRKEAGGLNSSGNLAAVLGLMDQKRTAAEPGSKRSRDDEDEDGGRGAHRVRDGGVVSKYIKSYTELSGGGGLEGMARRLELQRNQGKP